MVRLIPGPETGKPQEIKEHSFKTVWDMSMESRSSRAARREAGVERREEGLRIIDCGEFALGIESSYPIHEAFFVNPQTGRRFNNQPGYDSVRRDPTGRVVASRGKSDYLINLQTGEGRLLREE